MYNTQGSANFDMYNMTNQPVQGLPSQLPSINMRDQGLAMAVAGALIQQIQNDASRNNTRMYMYNMFSSNGWNNQHFASLFQFAHDYVVASGCNNENAVYQCVADALKMISGVTVNQTQALRQILPANHQQEANVETQRFNAVTQQLYQPQQQQNNWGGQPQQNSWGQPQQQNYGAMGLKPQGSNMFSNNSVPNAFANEQQVKTASGWAPRREPEPTPPPVVETHDYEEDTPVMNVRERNGKEFSFRQPHHLVYNINIHQVLVTPVTGGNEEQLIEHNSEEMMEYLKHELNPLAINQEIDRQREAGPKIVPQFEAPRSFQPAPDEIEVPLDVLVSRSTVVSNSQHAAQLRSMTSKVLCNSDPETQIVGFYYLNPDVVSCTPAEKKLAHQAVEELKLCEDVIDMSVVFNRQKREIRPSIWRMLETVLTKTLNKALQAGCGLDWKVDSFAEDASAAIANIRSNVGGKLSELFNKNAIDLLKLTLRESTRSELAEFIGIGDIRNGQTDTSTAVLDAMFGVGREIYCVVLPWYSTELGFSFQGRAGQVLSQETPKLYQLIVDAVTETHTTDRSDCLIVINTKDDFKLEVYRSLVDQESLVITTV